MKSTGLLVVPVLMTVLTYAQEKRPLTPSDIYRLQTISDPQLSPDGKWIVYS
jgi:hypothetical protein